MTAQPLNKFRLLSWQQLPTVPVYMEQLLQLVNQTLAPLGISAVTKTMVNSYVKQHFFSRPTAGRQYARHQLVAVLVVTILKQDFSLTTISQAILTIRESRQIEARYTQFSRAFEQTLRRERVELALDPMTRAIQLAAQTVGAHLLTKQQLALLVSEVSKND
ncbi:hypothetical protein C5Z25_06125 [Lactobacillus sp. CBA3605]|uniref:DUF1836 domain-containing protein n=1 Tax=Lactobacillus sp. CBA3605 TaxID=2099788 RepID=UPI000CFB84AC|nr:DUF1836 domain-containing protein [Lactobacillus sp. CBA3605]AVK61370.1 hypothetical protein C5Z25_06125 [Lactobacillus sp. CBA3605]